MTAQLSELWKYRELFYFLAWRDVKIRYKQTIFGAAWAILQPLLSMLIFLFLFARFAKLPTDGIPPALFYYSALVPWVYFSGTLSLCGNSLLSNVNLLTKVYFPRCILPAAVALGGLVDFGISAGLIGGFLIYYKVAPGLRVLMLIPLTLLLVTLTYGLGMLLSAVAVKYRDVKYATPFAIQLGFFATPILWPIDIVPEQYRVLLVLNPLVGIIESFRCALIPSKSIPWGLLTTSAIMTAVIVIVSAVYFLRAERHFADLA